MSVDDPYASDNDKVVYDKNKKCCVCGKYNIGGDTFGLILKEKYGKKWEGKWVHYRYDCIGKIFKEKI